MGDLLGSQLQGATVALALLGALFGVGLFAALAALTGAGAGMFRVPIRPSEIVLACLAQSTAAGLVLYGIGPLLLRMTAGASPIIGNIMMALLLFGIPPLLLGVGLQIAGRLKNDAGTALGLWGYGTFTAVLALIVLLLSALLPTDVRALPLVSVGIEAFKNLVWLMLVIGGGLAFAGYTLGSKLKIPVTPPIGADTDRTDSIPPPPPPPPSKPHSNQWISYNGQQYPLYDGVEMVIGRVESCGIRLPNDDEISRQHAVVRAVGGKAVLQDKGSRNGTYLNNTRITSERVLQDNDEIRVGASQLTFKSA